MLKITNVEIFDISGLTCGTAHSGSLKQII